MRNTLRLFFIFIELLAYCTLLVGYVKHILVSKELKKQTGTERTREKALGKLKVANRHIFIGFIAAFSLRVIGILITHGLL